MSSSEEMRRVIEHAAAQLEAALERENASTYPEVQTIAGIAYSLGVMRLLASYLVVTDQPDPAECIHRDEQLTEAMAIIEDLRAELAELRAKTVGQP